MPRKQRNLSFWFNLGYSQIKIDHIADYLLKHNIKIGVHLINVELSQLLTLVAMCLRHDVTFKQC